MKNFALPLLAAAALAAPAPAAAQATMQVQPISGTRLDVAATGEVTRVPDVAIISTGVVTRATTATAAIRGNATRMERVRAALRAAGIADKDIQTSSLNLNPEYNYVQNQPPRLTGYTASNQVTVRFRDIGETGKILDALVAEGANQISGRPDHRKPERPGEGPRHRHGRARRSTPAPFDGWCDAAVRSPALAVPPPVPMYARRAMSADAATKVDPASIRSRRYR